MLQALKRNFNKDFYNFSFGNKKMPWLDNKSGFFVFKILNAGTYTNRYLTTDLWYEFNGERWDYY